MRSGDSGGVGFEEKGWEEEEGERGSGIAEGSGQRIRAFEQKGEENNCERCKGETKRRERIMGLSFKAESFRAISICSAGFSSPLFFTPQGLGFKPVKRPMEDQ